MTDNRVLDCLDFAGNCCELCHSEISGHYNIIPVLKEDRVFARVCCTKVSQAENRRDGITEPIK